MRAWTLRRVKGDRGEALHFRSTKIRNHFELRRSMNTQPLGWLEHFQKIRSHRSREVAKETKEWLCCTASAFVFFAAFARRNGYISISFCRVVVPFGPRDRDQRLNGC